MNRLRMLFVGAGALVFVLFFAGPVLATITTQQAQIGITIVVNVTGTPVAYIPHSAPAARNASVIAAKMSLHAAPIALQHAFHAESMHFAGVASKLIAQAQVQHSILVQAEVTPNPNATLLYSGSNEVTINASPGSTQYIPCAFTVTVDSTKNWTLDEGVSNDFETGWSGGDLANNTYVNSATPQPTATPYIVYADDGKLWSLAKTGTTLETYCVGLTLTVPASITDGTYSTNAIYTLFF